MDWLKKTYVALWCHRTSYAALAVLNSALYAGLLDKGLCGWLLVGCYVALVLQRH